MLLVASPFAKRASVDHTFYGVRRPAVIELILGLPPMSQRCRATPMHNAFTGTPNVTAYRRSDRAASLDERAPKRLRRDQYFRMNFAEAIARRRSAERDHLALGKGALRRCLRPAQCLVYASRAAARR
jgi:hypothetical protein